MVINRKIVGELISQILPPKCPLSGEIVESPGMLSPKAWQSLNFISPPFCDRCGRPLEIESIDTGPLTCAGCLRTERIYNSARSAIVYDDVSRDLILGFKHGDQTYMTLTFAPWLKRAGADMLMECDLLVPVPLHWLRMVRRRYNQSALIAGRLSKETGISHGPDILKRVRHTPVQGHLSAKDRHKNVRNAFTVSDKNKARVRDKKIVLIDDVFTTGATVEECTQTLYDAGASLVDILTVARVSRPDTIS